MSETVSPTRALSSRGGSSQNEPSMMLHRPSSARSQDVRHVLTRTFGDLFTREAISVDTIKNLITTRGGEDEYHERYVDSLQEVLKNTESKLSEITMLEKHIMQAEAKAMSADERHTHRVTEGQQDDLGIPQSSNHFRSCIDYELMKKHNLLTPDRYANYEPPKVSKPQAPSAPTYLKETSNFAHHSKGKKDKMEMLKESRFLNKSQTEIPIALSQSKISQLNTTLDDEDKESVDYMKDGSEAGDNYDGIARFDHSAKSSAKWSRKSNKRTWTEQLAVEEREREREDLQKLQSRTNYLKNPRFDAAQAKLLTSGNRAQAKDINIKRAPTELEPIEKVQVFLSTPSVVTFTEYKVGQVYEATLDLKNISSSLRPVRVLPTSTNFFTVGLGQFPGEQGLVASGMSAQFKVRFMPDSLGEYSDEICVQSQCTEPLIVKVIAKRPPPVLTLPPEINIGECLVGGTKIGKFLVKNEGGNGKFCFIPKQRWPVTNFKSSVNPASLDVAPFQVRPAIFELGHKETTCIEIVFRPSELGQANHEVLMLCDNCHMRTFNIIGKGQYAAVEFVAIDGGTSDPQTGEMCDATAQKLIRFEDLNPFTYTQKTMILSNTTNVALPFEWMVVKPQILPGSSDESGEDNEGPPAVARTLDVESPFSIEPQNGVLEASGIANFTLTFAPPEVNKYHSVLHLVLPGIPHQPEPADEKGITSKEEIVNMDITSLEIECKAECIPLQVVVQPYAIFVNGKNLVGTTVRRHFTFINNSVSAATFQWECPSNGNILEVTPALGEVGPMMSADMEVSITGCSVGKMHEVLWCHVKNLSEPVALHVNFEVKGPEVYIDEPDVNFGLVRFGTTASTTLTLHNDSQMPAVYEIKEKLPANSTEEQSEFVFKQQKGELRPLETRKVEVEFYPQACKSVRTFFELTVSDGGQPRTVAVRADVQNPEVCLLSCNLNIPKLFVNMPMTQTVTIINKSLLTTKYQWGEPMGKQVDDCMIQIQKHGELPPRENAEVELTFTSKILNDISDVILPCYVSGIDEPLLLSITAKVEGLQIAYAIQDFSNMPNFDEATADSSILDYGKVFVKSTAKKYLYMRNKTSIPAEYALSLKNHSSRPPTPPTSKYSANGGGRKALLHKTPNITDPHSKSKERALIELQQQLLKTDKGLAIVPTPSHGKLGPYEELVIELALYTDMWGEYEDVLTCKVSDLDPYRVPVSVHVTGIPLQFHMAAVTKDPTLRKNPKYMDSTRVVSKCLFGTHASNAKPITRTVRINNYGPVDTRVDWKMFNVASEDEQLIDFVVSFGESFPKKDDKGNIITHPPQSPVPLSSRPPTELIPNTPDSTPTPSRQGDIHFSRGSTRPGTRATNIDGNDDPLITVSLRLHEGHEAQKPFTIHPEQMVVPARDKGFINVTFNPESGDPNGEDCNSFILGYLNMEPKDSCVDGRVSRVIGYSMEPMRLNLAGCIEPAFLYNEFMDDEGLRFRGVASDLMRDGVTNPKAYYRISNGTKLTNLTEALLCFKIDVSHPFIFTKSIPVAGEDNYISLKPNESSEIYIDFCISPDQLSLIDKHTEVSEDKIGSEPIVVVKRDNERQIHFTQNLSILFSSGAVQELPLHASLVIPSLTTSSTEIDFGVCLVGQRKQKTILLKNRTRSASYWSSKRSSANSPCDDLTFMVEPHCGSLEAHIAHVTQSDSLVTISFLAREECHYEAEFTISGLLGEVPIIISMKGIGSFDEKYRDLLNLVIEPEKNCDSYS